MLHKTLQSQLLAAPEGHLTPIKPMVDTKSALLFAAIENFADGLLIVSKTGEILLENRCAQKLLRAIQCPRKTIKTLPLIIRRACQALLNSPHFFPAEDRIVLEDEIQVPAQGRIRVRVQWFNLDTNECFLVTLEDLTHSVECSAITDAQRYNLTPREAEVWQLKRAGHSYKDIAATLYISENTVKKHLKNVYAKRDMAGDNN